MKCRFGDHFSEIKAAVPGGTFCPVNRKGLK